MTPTKNWRRCAIRPRAKGPRCPASSPALPTLPLSTLEGGPARPYVREMDQRWDALGLACCGDRWRRHVSRAEGVQSCGARTGFLRQLQLGWPCLIADVLVSPWRVAPLDVRSGIAVPCPRAVGARTDNLVLVGTKRRTASQEGIWNGGMLRCELRTWCSALRVWGAEVAGSPTLLCTSSCGGRGWRGRGFDA